MENYNLGDKIYNKFTGKYLGLVKQDNPVKIALEGKRPHTPRLSHITKEAPSYALMMKDTLIQQSFTDAKVSKKDYRIDQLHFYKDQQLILSVDSGEPFFMQTFNRGKWDLIACVWHSENPDKIWAKTLQHDEFNELLIDLNFEKGYNLVYKLNLNDV